MHTSIEFFDSYLSHYIPNYNLKQYIYKESVAHHITSNMSYGAKSSKIRFNKNKNTNQKSLYTN